MRFISYFTGSTLIINRILRPMSSANVSHVESSLSYNSTPRNVFAISATGGGVHAISWIFSVPGASSSVVEGSVPYSRQSLRKILDSIKEVDANGSCSVETAQLQAKAAYHSAVEHVLLTENDISSLSTLNIFGVGCNAALVSDTPKKGAHRCHIAICSKDGYSTFSIELDKAKLRNRTEEDRICSQLVIDAISRHCGLPLGSNSPLYCDNFNNNEKVEVSTKSHTDLIDEVGSGRLSHALLFPQSIQQTVALDCTIPVGSIVFPGSFNPLHIGHIELVKANIHYILKKRQASSNVVVSPFPLIIFEIAIVNADKPALSRIEIDRRVRQFLDHSESLKGLRYAVCVTSEPLFVGKSRIFKECTFALGADTVSRLLNRKYYTDKKKSGDGGATNFATMQLLNMVSALTVMKQNGCKFVVGGRVKQTNSGTSMFETLSDVLRENSYSAVLPESVLEMFEELGEAEFRVDLSSTELRNKNI